MSKWMMIVMLVACGGPAAVAPSTGSAAPAPVVAPTPSAAPNPWQALNLGFEQGEDPPAGWDSPTSYEWRTARDIMHGGARSGRLRSAGASGYGVAIARVSAATVRGQVVKLHGWVKTADTRGLAGLFLTAKGGGGASDTMPWQRLNGSTDWTEVTVEVDVPDQAETLELGAMLVGEGTAWFDDLQLEVTGRGASIVLAGVVVDAAGRPVADAEVALQAGNGIAAHVRADAQGAFHFATTAGRWGFSASHAGQVGGFIDTQPFAHDTRDITLRLGARDGVRVHGTIGPGRLPRDSYVQVSLTSTHDSDGFAVPVAADGTFEVTLPRAERYLAQLLGPVSSGGNGHREGDEVTIDIALPLQDAQLPPVAPELAPWIAAHAAALATAEPGHGFADLAALGALVGKARIVGLGEATHGTREFFQLKHRVLEYLVATQGFTVFALEADQAECRAINDYVLGGAGDPKVALDGLYKWPWDTDEVLDLIAWMRTWNAAHRAKVQFAGFDMLTSRVAYAAVADYLAQVDAAAAPGLLAPVTVLGRHTASAAIAPFTQAQVDGLLAGLGALRAAFDKNARGWAKRTSLAACDQARHDVTLLEQATARYLAARAGQGDGQIRSRAMADNLLWILDHQPAGARIVAWAHNSHVALVRRTPSAPDNLNMGGYLHAKLQTGYRAIGFLFSQGAFQIWTAKPRTGLNEVTIGPPPASDATVPFAQTGKPLLFLDLHAIPARGPIHDWFLAPHPIREAGVTFTSESDMSRPTVLPQLFDAVFFVDKTTRARPMAFP